MHLVAEKHDVKPLTDFEPYTGRIVVVEDEIKDRTEGGLYIPKNQSEVIATTGVVVATGEDVPFCEIGNRVCFARYSGSKFTWKGKEYRIMNEEDLLGLEVCNG